MTDVRPCDVERLLSYCRALLGGIGANELAGFHQHYGSLNLRVARNGQIDVK